MSFFNLKGEILQKLQYKFCINITFGCFPSALALSIDKLKAVNFIGLFGKDANILTRKLPAVGNVTLTTDVSFITIVKVYFTFHIQLFKLSQFFALKFIIFRQRLSLITTPYAFISSAKLLKKALKVLSLTLLPLVASHSALAVRMRWRFTRMASKTDSLSSSTVIIRCKHPIKYPFPFCQEVSYFAIKKYIMRRIMSKEDFLAILARQQQSGLTIKDFCENEASCLFLTPILTLCVAILLEAEYSLFL